MVQSAAGLPLHQLTAETTLSAVVGDIPTADVNLGSSSADMPCVFSYRLATVSDLGSSLPD
jgi:hypothetical protein